MTFGIARQTKLQPRLFAYVEPVLDSRGDASRVDLAVGMGGAPTGGRRADVYVLQQTYPDRPRANLSALVVDLQVRIGRRGQAD